MANPITNPNPQIPQYFKKFYPQNFLTWLQSKFFSFLFWLGRVAVKWFKRIRIPFTNFVIVLGFDLFQEVFTRWQDFPVPHDDKTKPKDQGGVGWEPPFLLARPNTDTAYQKMHQYTREIFFDHIDPNTGEKFIDQLPQIAKDTFEGLLPDPVGNVPAERDLGWEYTYPGFLTIFEEFFGITIQDADQVAFVCDLLVVSGFFFSSAKASTKPAKYKSAQKAFDHAWGLLLTVVEEARNNPANAKGALKYAVEMDDGAGNYTLSNDEITSYFLGMILGSVPTNGNAHARILEMLLKNKDAWDTAWYYREREFHPDKDPEFLAVLHECLRMNYILPGLWRVANKDGLVIGEGEKYELKNIKNETVLLVSGMAAMHDPKHFDNRFEFRSDRSYWAYLNYGHQMHFCVGWDMSNIMLLEYFRALVVRKFRKNPNGTIKGRSMFPWKFDVLYDAPR